MSVPPTTVVVEAAASRARVTLVTGAIAPRVISRGPAYARIALVAAGALLLPGDQVTLNIRVGRGCRLELEDIGGTVAYGAEPAVKSYWTTTIALEEGARIEWDARPLVVAEGADVERSLTIRLATGSVGVIRDTAVWGRVGERGGHLRARLIAEDPAGPLLVEQLQNDGRTPQPGVLGRHRVLDTVVLLGARPTETPAGTHAKGPFRAPGVMHLQRAGAVARYLGDHTHDSPLDEVWSRWRHARVDAQYRKKLSDVTALT